MQEVRNTYYPTTFSVEGRHLYAIEIGKLKELHVPGLGTLGEDQLNTVLMMVRAGHFHARGRIGRVKWWALDWNEVA